jgi:hypothetical protein
VEAIGGIAPYTYRWNNSQYTSPFIYDLPVGRYSVAIIDRRGCVQYRTYDIKIREDNLPKTINVQGLLKDTADLPLKDSIYDVRFALYTSLAGSTAIWTELRNDVYVRDGLFSIMLGEFEPLYLCFDETYYLGITLIGESEMSPRLPLSTSPYAFMARNVMDNSICTAKIVDKSVTLEKIRPDLLSGINGIRNHGGEISIVGGDNVSISNDTLGKTITISANGLNNVGNSFVSVHDASDNLKGAMIADPNTKAGALWLNGSNGNLNNLITSLSGHPNNGYIGVNDENGSSQAGMYVDANGKGQVFADDVVTVVDHPTKSDLQIRYVHLKGPEAGTYLRGTARLSQGAASIDFPDHFVQMIEDGTVTVVVSPLSELSKGIAVVKTGRNGFRVKELFGGQGDYEFSYIVHAVQKGYGDMEVLQKKGSMNGEAQIRGNE